MKSIVTPEALLNYMNYRKSFPDFKCPELCFLCFNNSWKALLLECFENSRPGPAGIKILKKDNFEFGIQKCIIGPSSASINLEELCAMGFKKFISIGSAGALKTPKNDLSTGDIVHGISAICDENISHQYGNPEGKRIDNTSALQRKFTSINPQIKTAISWTTDAPFMETSEKFTEFTTMGATIVEMEMASLLSVAAFRHVEMLNLFAISDLLYIDRWKPGFSSEAYFNGKKKLSKLLMDFLKAIQ